MVSHRDDDHALAVLDEVGRRGHGAVLFDLASFPGQTALVMQHDPSGSRFALRLGAGPPIDLAACRAVWWRRPQPFVIDEAITDPDHRHFAYAECHDAIAGLWSALDVSWVDEPTRVEAAAKKPFQLRVAREAGLRIPRTLVTNDVDAARAFVREIGVGRTVYKAFTATEQAWRETRILRPAEVDLLARVALAPVIFQEYVPAAVDLRVTIVGGQVFPAAIYSQQTGYEVDFRLEIDTVRIEPCALPPPVAAALLRLMRRLGLRYGAIDMRRTPEGDHVFLEINPAGQWLFVEQRTGLPITPALVGELLGHDAGRPRPPAGTAPHERLAATAPSRVER